jgi:MFS family permease
MANSERAPRLSSSRAVGSALGLSRLGSARWLLLLIGLGVFFGTLDQTVVVTVLADILASIHLPLNRDFSQASWIINGYLIAFTIAMPLMGRVADVYGRARVFTLCLLIFVAGSICVALAPNLQLLVAARCFQAVGGGGLMPVGFAMGAEVAGKRRAPVLGAFAACNNGSTFLGPIWGAAVASVWDWRGIFWLNVALVVPLAVAVPLLARNLRGRDARVDWPGAALMTAGLFAITFALSDNGANPRPLIESLVIGAAGVAALIGFVLWERRSDAPMIDIDLLRIPRVQAAMASYFFLGGALITALVTVPLMANVLWGESTTASGLVLMRLLLLLPAGNVAGGFLAARIGYRPTAVLGVALALAGFLWMHGWPYRVGDTTAFAPSTWHLWGALALIGLGLGFCDGPLVATVIDAVPGAQRASATALLLVMWTTGMIVGLALLANLGIGAFSSDVSHVSLDDPAYTLKFLGVMHHVFNQAFVVAALMLIVGFVLTLRLGGGRASERILSPYEALGE